MTEITKPVPVQAWEVGGKLYVNEAEAQRAAALIAADSALDALLQKHKTPYEHAVSFDDLLEHAAEFGASLTAYAEATKGAR